MINWKINLHISIGTKENEKGQQKIAQLCTKGNFEIHIIITNMKICNNQSGSLNHRFQNLNLLVDSREKDGCPEYTAQNQNIINKHFFMVLGLTIG